MPLNTGYTPDDEKDRWQFYIVARVRPRNYEAWSPHQEDSPAGWPYPYMHLAGFEHDHMTPVEALAAAARTVETLARPFNANIVRSELATHRNRWDILHGGSKHNLDSILKWQAEMHDGLADASGDEDIQRHEEKIVAGLEEWNDRLLQLDSKLEPQRVSAPYITQLVYSCLRIGAKPAYFSFLPEQDQLRRLPHPLRIRRNTSAPYIRDGYTRFMIFDITSPECPKYGIFTTKSIGWDDRPSKSKWHDGRSYFAQFKVEEGYTGFDRLCKLDVAPFLARLDRVEHLKSFECLHSLWPWSDRTALLDYFSNEHPAVIGSDSAPSEGQNEIIDPQPEPQKLIPTLIPTLSQFLISQIIQSPDITPPTLNSTTALKYLRHRRRVQLFETFYRQAIEHTDKGRHISLLALTMCLAWDRASPQPNLSRFGGSRGTWDGGHINYSFCPDIPQEDIPSTVEYHRKLFDWNDLNSVDFSCSTTLTTETVIKLCRQGITRFVLLGCNRLGVVELDAACAKGTLDLVTNSQSPMRSLQRNELFLYTQWLNLSFTGFGDVKLINRAPRAHNEKLNPAFAFHIYHTQSGKWTSAFLEAVPNRATRIFQSICDLLEYIFDAGLLQRHRRQLLEQTYIPLHFFSHDVRRCGTDVEPGDFIGFAPSTQRRDYMQVSKVTDEGERVYNYEKLRYKRDEWIFCYAFADAKMQMTFAFQDPNSGWFQHDDHGKDFYCFLHRSRTGKVTVHTPRSFRHAIWGSLEMDAEESRWLAVLEMQLKHGGWTLREHTMINPDIDKSWTNGEFDGLRERYKEISPCLQMQEHEVEMMLEKLAEIAQRTPNDSLFL